MKYIVALDQGTTSSRALLIDENGKLKGIQQKEFKQIYPKQGWVEHDPNEILSTQIQVFEELVSSISPEDIISIGITNQRETTVIWDSETGKPLYNAIVWQDKRTSNICDQMKKDGLESYVKENTGLVIDSYFSATKIKWLLDNCKNAYKKAREGELAFGTIDTWLLWKLTNGKIHATDFTNASRTQIFNINTMIWDKELLEIFKLVLISML